jgi:hypothetical protein
MFFRRETGLFRGSLEVVKKYFSKGMSSSENPSLKKPP